MAQADDARTLAERLRELRSTAWPDVRITQSHLAQALGVSVPLISAWEKRRNPVIPLPDRLTSYATLFATRRSVDDGGVRLLPAEELTADERQRRDELQAELLALREAATEEPRPEETGVGPNGPFHFPDQAAVTIVCAQLPPRVRELMPYADPEDPDYVETYSYADLDALLELHGHIRAVNPESDINLRVAPQLTPDDYTAHLVLLGGVDWNPVNREVSARLPVPVSQVPRGEDDRGGHFEVHEGDAVLEFRPQVRDVDDHRTLVEDVAQFIRGPNPFNRARTVTICNGTFGRGVLGAVRALTDERFRHRNAAYLRERFAGNDTFSVLARVPIVMGRALTPDWTLHEIRLHEWAEVRP